MPKQSISSGQLEQSFARAQRLQGELQRKERMIGRKAQLLAAGLTGLMEAGGYLHRSGVGLHAFSVGDAVCLTAAYLEPDGQDFRYRYAVLSGGETARRALRMAVLDPVDSDEPGPERRIALATYSDYADFIERLPAYIADITREIEVRVRQTESAESKIRQARQSLTSVRQAARRRGS